MLTFRQRGLLLFIDGRIKSTGSSPTYDEMAAAMSLKSKAGIVRMLDALEERGFIRRSPQRARAIEVVRLHDAETPASFDDFHNRLRIMVGIDRQELVNAGAIRADDVNAWESFRFDPYRYFIRIDDEAAMKIWSVIEHRATRRGAHG